VSRRKPQPKRGSAAKAKKSFIVIGQNPPEKILQLVRGVQIINREQAIGFLKAIFEN
jgi:hypothetical protein